MGTCSTRPVSVSTVSPRPAAVVTGDLFRELHAHVLSDRVSCAQISLQHHGPEGPTLLVRDEQGVVVLSQALAGVQFSRIDDSGLILNEIRMAVCFLPPAVVDIMCGFSFPHELSLDDPIVLPSVKFQLPHEEPPPARRRSGISWLTSSANKSGTGVAVHAWRFYFDASARSSVIHAFMKELFECMAKADSLDPLVVCDSNSSALACVNGSKLLFWDGACELDKARQYSLKTKSDEELLPTCTVVANCGVEPVLKVLFLSSKWPDTMFVLDPKQGEITEEWKLGTEMLTLTRCKAAEGKLVAAGENTLIVIDTALADNKVTWSVTYSLKRDAPSPSGYEPILVAAEGPRKLLAVSNDEHKLRVYNGVSFRTRGRMALGNLDIRAMQVSEAPRSQYVAVTKQRCVLVFSTIVEHWSGKSVFDGVPLEIVNSMHPCKLTLSHADCIRFSIAQVSFTPATFCQLEAGENEEEEEKRENSAAASGPNLVIATSTGAFVIKWTISPRLDKDLSGSYVSTSISKQQQPISQLLWANNTLIAVSNNKELFAVVDRDR